MLAHLVEHALALKGRIGGAEDPVSLLAGLLRIGFRLAVLRHELGRRILRQQAELADARTQLAAAQAASELSLASLEQERQRANEAERAKAAAACRYADEVVENCPFVLTNEFLDTYRIDLVVHGDDHSSESAKKYYSVALDRGIYRTVPYTAGVSTSELIQRIVDRGADAAKRLKPHGA